MNESLKTRRRRSRLVAVSVGVVAFAIVCIAGWIWWNIEKRAAAHRGLDGTWVDDSGQDVSYQFRDDGEFLIRQKIPGTMAPFTGDPGIEHRPTGKWTRNGQSINVQSEHHWGFELTLGEDGVLRGERVMDTWSAMGEYSRSKDPVVLTKK